MPKESQAQADPNEEPQVDDPLDASNVPDEGATELDNYFAEVDGMEMGEEGGQAFAADSESTELPKETFVDEDDSSDGEEEDQEEPEEGEDPLPDEDKEDEPAAAANTDRFRIRAKDEVESEALAMRKRHPDWSLKECIEKAEQLLGVTAKAETTAQAEPENETPTVADVSSQIKELRAKRKEASDSLEFETAEEIQMRIDDLLDMREELRFRENQEASIAQQREMTEFEQAYAGSEAKAVKFYPETTNPDSELVKRMVEIDERLAANGDPVYHSPDKPWILAREAAKQLGIIMADPAAPKAKAKKNSQGGRPMQPASGSARTSATAPARKLESALDGMDSLEDYESLVEAI